MIITIDGPAGSGKSTVARKLAARLGIPYLDTGAMYRVVTLAGLAEGLNLEDDACMAPLAASDRYRLDLGPTHIRVTLDGRDVTEEIRSMRVNEHTRFVAALPGVRAALVEKQRELGQRLGSLVTEGRDQGSVAFPDADLKFFLDATIEKRVERRLNDLRADGEEVTPADVLANLTTRDRTDSQRRVGPLKVPAGAVSIDTSELSIAQVLDVMLEHLRQAGLGNGPVVTRSAPGGGSV
ncbi:MAG: (d)CMP kinase [Phycisphaerae bacterium]